MDNQTSKEVINRDIVQKYKEVMMEMMHLSFPLLSTEELSAAIDYSINRHFEDRQATVFNNYKNAKINMGLADLADYILRRKPVIASYGTMFRPYGEMANPLYEMVDGFLKDRDALKKTMYQYPKGSEMFQRYQLLQLLKKIDANGFYGCMGQYSCIYYNLYCAASITTEGRMANATLALFFESFFCNNVPMGSMNELMMFIYNVLHEDREFKTNDIINIHPEVSEVFMQLMNSTGFGWVPNEDEMYIVWDLLLGLKQEDLDRLFYKNNLFYFVDNKAVTQAILYILQTLEKPFINPNDPPEEIKTSLDALSDLMYEFVYYDKQMIDKLEKIHALDRKVSVIQDTDSAIIVLDGWYNYIRQLCVNVPMKIKHESIDLEKFYDKGQTEVADTEETVSEYDFVNDKVMEVKRSINPLVMIPEDGLRYSIINMISYICTRLVNDYIAKWCDNTNSNVDGRKCRMYCKNEYLMKRILITEAKKHYASKLELQEGNQVPESESLSIAGIEALTKSTNNPAVQEKMKKVLYEDILNTDDIDQIQILKDIAKIENEIYTSIMNGEKIYYKPLKVKSMSAYDDPMRIQGISASYVYNYLHEPGTEAIDLTARNSVDIAKVDLNKKNVDRIKDSHPYVYEKACELLKEDKFTTGVTSVAIPLNETVPSWILPFVNYSAIINDNVGGFPLESCGLYRGADTNNSTNLIHF